MAWQQATPPPSPIRPRRFSGGRQPVPLMLEGAQPVPRRARALRLAALWSGVAALVAGLVAVSVWAARVTQRGN